MSIEYENGFLHTSSSYYSGSNFFTKEAAKGRKDMFKAVNINADFEAALAHARSKEQIFYHLYTDANDYDTFITEIRKLFNMADQAGDRIRELSNASLKNDYNFKARAQKTKFKVMVTHEMLEKAKLELTKCNTDISQFDGDVYLDIDKEADLQIIKGVMNFVRALPDDEQFTKNFQPIGRKHIRNTSKFGVLSPDTKALERWLSDEMDDHEAYYTKILINGVRVTKIPPSNSTTTDESTIEIPEELIPFTKFTSSQIKDILASGDSSLKAQLNEAKEKVKTFLKGRLRISSDEKGMLIDAFDKAWAGLPDDFFFEGDNLVKAVLGNVGEFQLRLFDAYARVASSRYNGKLGEIIGQIAEDGRGQSRSDYQIMVALKAPMASAGSEEEAIGIQAKNVDRTKYNSIEVNTDLGLIAPNLGPEITTAIANYSFNSSIASKTGNMRDFLAKYLDTMIWRGLNFNVNDGLIAEHTNTFYWFGGEMIIPVSEIILRLRKNNEVKKAENLMKKPETTITGLEIGSIGDEGYEEGDPPLFVNYWHGNQNTSWTPANDNNSNFQKFLTGIRVHSTLNFASFLKVSGGSARYSFY